VPATVVPRRRRRRFPERELLERLRQYEDLLRQNNVRFEPLYKDSAGDKESPPGGASYDSDDRQPEAPAADCSSPAATTASDRVYEAK
jgi:hypothetical protein